MKLEFVNHASVIYEHGDVRLIADPWIEGTVFDNSWAHLSKSEFTYEDYQNISHIWFSHEHPDHFFPPNVKKIPEEFRSRITVLFKQTLDKKVAGFCRKLGFKEVVELPHGKTVPLKGGLEITSYQYSLFMDTAVTLSDGTTTLLNMNDCKLSGRPLQRVLRRHPEIDFVFRSHSSASPYPHCVTADDPSDLGYRTTPRAGSARR